MATIRSQMVLDDRMTRVLNNTIGALNTVINSFEQVQRASGQAFDTTEIEQARSGLIGASMDLQDIADGYQKAAAEEEKLNRGIQTGTTAMDGMLGKVKHLVGAMGVSMGIKKLIGLSDQMTGTEARLNLLVGDGGSVDALEAKIMASAQRSRAAYLDTANAVASMGANAGNAFSGNDEIIAFMEQVNKQFVIGGASAQGQSAAMLQLTQAMAAGALRGEELNSILENAPGIARAIESYMGIAEGSIKKYAQEGQVTAEIVKNALFAAADETNAKFESMPMTWGQIWTNMQNRALSALDPILNKLNAVANSQQFSVVANAAMQAFSVVGTVAASALDFVVNLGAAIVNNWAAIEPIVLGVALAMGTYYAILLALNAAEAVHNGIKAVSTMRETVHAAALAMSTGATFAATVAQYGLNAALMACPITWIVLGIVAILAIIMSVIRGLDLFGAKSASVFGTFMGVLNVVWHFILNIISGIFNAIGALCTDIGIAFHNTIANVQGWWYGLLSTVLTVVEGICAALNRLPFIEFDYSGITAKADEYAAKSAEAYNSKEEYVSPFAAFGDAWSDGWAGDAFKSGAAWGDGVADKVGGLFDFDLGAAGDPYGGDFALDSIAADTGSIADSTGGMADALDVSTEQLEYLRDIAERDAINRFTTAEVKIDMTGMTNRIDGSADLDGVLSQLTDGFTEALLTAAEGVHA